MEHLRVFADWVNGTCRPDVAVRPVDGNKEFPATTDLLREAMRILRRADGSCPFDDGFRKFVDMPGRNGSKRHDCSADELGMVALWENRGTPEIASSLSGKLVVISNETVTSITEAQQADGIAVFRGELCLLVRDYRNILWHEAAHLFGAHDHYDENRTATPECEAANLCIMQWDPGHDESRRFCDQSITEMNTYFVETKQAQRLLAERCLFQNQGT
jgi:hypothetical protein